MNQKYHWLMAIILISVLFLIACDEEESTSKWVKYNGWNIVYLEGTPYEMGVQQGKYYKEAIIYLDDYFNGQSKNVTQSIFQQVFTEAVSSGIYDTSISLARPEIVEECQGIYDGSNGALEVNMCIAYNSALFILEHSPIMCSGFVVTDEATVDGEMLHGRSQDYPPFGPGVIYPTIFVRKTTGKIPYVIVGYPGQIAPITAMNAQGLTLELNEAGSDKTTLTGVDNLQINRLIMEEATTLAEAQAIIENYEQPTSELLLMASGNENSARTFEMAADFYGSRSLSADKILYITNHYIEDSIVTETGQSIPDADSSVVRYLRLSQLLEPNGADPFTTDTYYGEIDVEKAIAILRDRKNPNSGSVSADNVLNMNTIGGNAVLHSMVFAPLSGNFWLAGGVPEGMDPDRLLEGLTPLGNTNPYIGFNIHDLLAGKHPNNSRNTVNYP